MVDVTGTEQRAHGVLQLSGDIIVFTYNNNTHKLEKWEIPYGKRKISKSVISTNSIPFVGYIGNDRYVVVPGNNYTIKDFYGDVTSAVVVEHGVLRRIFNKRNINYTPTLIDNSNTLLYKATPSYAFKSIDGSLDYINYNIYYIYSNAYQFTTLAPGTSNPTSLIRSAFCRFNSDESGVTFLSFKNLRKHTQYAAVNGMTYPAYMSFDIDDIISYTFVKAKTYDEFPNPLFEPEEVPNHNFVWEEGTFTSWNLSPLFNKNSILPIKNKGTLSEIHHDVPPQYIFGTDDERASYFIAHPTELVVGLIVISDGTYWSWGGESWVYVEWIYIEDPEIGDAYKVTMEYIQVRYSTYVYNLYIHDIIVFDGESFFVIKNSTYNTEPIQLPDSGCMLFPNTGYQYITSQNTFNSKYLKNMTVKYSIMGDGTFIIRMNNWIKPLGSGNYTPVNVDVISKEWNTPSEYVDTTYDLTELKTGENRCSNITSIEFRVGNTGYPGIRMFVILEDVQLTKFEGELAELEHVDSMTIVNSSRMLYNVLDIDDVVYTRSCRTRAIQVPNASSDTFVYFVYGAHRIFQWSAFHYVYPTVCDLLYNGVLLPDGTMLYPSIRIVTTVDQGDPPVPQWWPTIAGTLTFGHATSAFGVKANDPDMIIEDDGITVGFDGIIALESINCGADILYSTTGLCAMQERINDTILVVHDNIVISEMGYFIYELVVYVPELSKYYKFSVTGNYEQYTPPTYDEEGNELTPEDITAGTYESSGWIEYTTFPDDLLTQFSTEIESASDTIVPRGNDYNSDATLMAKYFDCGNSILHPQMIHIGHDRYLTSYDHSSGYRACFYDLKEDIIKHINGTGLYPFYYVQLIRGIWGKKRLLPY